MNETQMVSTIVSIYFDSPQLARTTKTNYETSYRYSIDMLNFYYLKMCLILVSPPHFVHDFQ